MVEKNNIDSLMCQPECRETNFNICMQLILQPNSFDFISTCRV
jgi:hypothetical protein